MSPKAKITLILLGFFAWECGEQPKAAITVGMTYEEVEAILGKPMEIARGVNQLSIRQFEEMTVDEYVSYDIDSTKAALSRGDATVWRAIRDIETVGTLIYVTWVYGQTSVDTHYAFKRVFLEKKDTSTTYSYFLNDEIVQKRIFDVAKVGNYLLPEPEGGYEIIVEPGYTPVHRIDRKTILPRTIIETIRTQKPSVREYYYVKQVYRVTFDASSGRVVQSGLQPFEVSTKPLQVR